jgi:hypothetical protein
MFVRLAHWGQNQSAAGLESCLAANGANGGRIQPKNTIDMNRRDRVVTPFGWIRLYFA